MRYSDLLCSVNKPSLDDFHGWVFHPGMLFNAPNKWWGDQGQRDFPHEGVDFCLYKTLPGKILQLSHHTKVPAVHDGTVKHLFTDYLGQAVVVEHSSPVCEKRIPISIYAHTNPTKQVHPGVSVKRGDVIATLADTRQSKTPIFPHLHYTLGMASTDISYNGFVWNHMRDPDFVLLMDPLDIISS